MGTSIEINGGEEGLWRIATALSLSFSCATVPLPPPTSGRHSLAVAVERTSRAESEVEGAEHGHDGGQRRGDWCGSGGAAGAGAARGSAPGRAEVRKPGKAGEHRRSQRGRADEEKLVRRSLEVRRDCAWTCTQPGGQWCKPRLHRDCRCLGAPCGNTRSPTLSRISSLLPWSATRGRLARCKVGVRACGAGQTSAAALAFSPGRQHVDGPAQCRVGARRAVLAGPQQEPWPSPLDDNEWTAMAVQGRCRARGAGQTCWVPAVSGFKVLPARAEWELVETLGVV